MVGWSGYNVALIQVLCCLGQPNEVWALSKSPHRMPAACLLQFAILSGWDVITKIPAHAAARSLGNIVLVVGSGSKKKPVTGLSVSSSPEGSRECQADSYRYRKVLQLSPHKQRMVPLQPASCCGRPRPFTPRRIEERDVRWEQRQDRRRAFRTRINRDTGWRERQGRAFEDNTMPHGDARCL
jgi:hypothetical protein